MKRFNFSLQKILQLRKYREEDCKIQLGLAVGALLAIENRIRVTAENRMAAMGERFSRPADIFAWDIYIHRLEQEAGRLEEEKSKAAAAVEEKRAVYFEAARDLKAMEKLKEKKEKEHRKEMFAAETLELDLQANSRRHLGAAGEGKTA